MEYVVDEESVFTRHEGVKPSVGRVYFEVVSGDESGLPHVNISTAPLRTGPADCYSAFPHPIIYGPVLAHQAGDGSVWWTVHSSVIISRASIAWLQSKDVSIISTNGRIHLFTSRRRCFSCFRAVNKTTTINNKYGCRRFLVRLITTCVINLMFIYT